MFGDGLFNSKSDIWANQRRLMQPLFTKQAMYDWQSIIVNQANWMVDEIDINSSTINFSHISKQTIQKILIEILFGRREHGIREKQILEAIDVIVKGLFPHLLIETLGKGKLRYLLFFQNRKMQQSIQQFSRYVKDEILIKQQKPTHEKTLLSMLINAQDKSGYSMTESLLIDETVTLFFAGQDTTINTVSWFIYLIGSHPGIHQKITDEILNYKEESLAFDLIAKLPYTKAALYETLRLYPQAIALSRDVVEEITINEQSIQPGTSIIMSIYDAHRNPNYWDKPNEFYPEHFLNYKERYKYAFMPFGGGMHQCVGRHLAEFEMMIIIIALLRQFKFITNNQVKPRVSITYKPASDMIVSIEKV
jgi:cytochrome P450